MPEDTKKSLIPLWFSALTYPPNPDNTNARRLAVWNKRPNIALSTAPIDLTNQNHAHMTRTVKPLHLGIAIAGFLAWSVLATRKAISQLNFYIAAVKPKFDGMSPVLELRVMIQNPSQEKFELRAFVGNLFANGQLVGNVSSFTHTIVNPASEVVYPLSVRLALIGAASELFSIIQQGSGNTQKLVFKGTINANGAVLPIELAYKIF